VPDLPGCFTDGESEAAIRERIALAISAHVETLRERGDPVPVPCHSVAMVDVP
jgi:predicted RNase H-like HicB family nuclease